MKRKEKDGLFWLLTVLLGLVVLVAGLIVSLGYYARGYNLRAVDMRQFARVEKEEQVYTVSVDADAIVRAFHLPDPKTRPLDLSRYPDVAAVYSLTFLVEPLEEGWHIQTASDRPDVAEDLHKGGLKLTHTEWTWTKEQMQAVYEQGIEYPRRISVQRFIRCSKNDQGAYVLTLDNQRLLRVCALSEDSPGYGAILSLGCYVTPTDTGFLVETSSTLENVSELLAAAGVRLTDTTWTYTLEEAEALYELTQAELAAAAPAPTAEPTAEPTAAQGLLTSLYHVNQVPYRRAIQEAKKERYGKLLNSSQVVGEWFFVAKEAAARPGNCFRLLYEIATDAGKEYLLASLYDIQADIAPAAAQVTLQKVASLQEGSFNGDLPADSFTVDTLHGGSLVFAEDKGASPFSSDGLVFPDSLTRPLTEADICSLPTREDLTLLQVLGYARNEIFARCGNRFSDTSVYTKFYANYPWFQPKGSITLGAIRDSYPVAAENVDFIRSMEKLLSEG